MNTVYALECGWDREFALLGVYSSLDNAKAAAHAYARGDFAACGRDYIVRTVDLDRAEEGHWYGEQVWRRRLDEPDEDAVRERSKHEGIRIVPEDES